MADMNVGDFSFAKFGASVAGAFISLGFVKGGVKERAYMFVGGSALSYYCTPAIAQYMGGSDYTGVAGFFVGVFGMAIVSKIYDGIQAIDASALAKAMQARWARLWGVGGGGEP